MIQLKYNKEVPELKVKIVNSDKTPIRKEEAYQIIGEFIRSEVSGTKAS